jgi:tocopherol O-methyltransferase
MIYPPKAQNAETVATHYDTLDHYYRKLWGEFINHGYWKTGQESLQQAIEQLVELVAQAGKIDSTSKVCDVGCGYGATSRYLARKKGAQVTSLTVSKTQWQYCRTHDPESTNPRYLLADFLHNTFPSSSFDVVISIESSEEMVDKNHFFSEVARILRPGGRFVACCWLSKDHPTSWEVKHLLEPICEERHFPSIGTSQEYRKMMEKAGLSEIKFHDISSSVKKTWSIGAYRLTKAILSDPKVRALLRNKQVLDRVFAKTVYRIWLAHQTKSIRYGIFTAVK